MVLRFFLLSAFILASCVSIERNNPDDPGSSNYKYLTAFNGVHGAPVTYMGETYQTVVIGTQTWFQRNLNYAANGSKCGWGLTLTDENNETCKTYGRLYDWATAMNLPSDCNSISCASQISAKHQGICPDGWHIPSEADWNVLVQAEATNCKREDLCFHTGTKLKSAKGWNSYDEIPAGTDDYGFSALPGGYGSIDRFDFNEIGEAAGWWSSTDCGGDASNIACCLFLYYDSEKAYSLTYTKPDLLSIRCLKD